MDSTYASAADTGKERYARGVICRLVDNIIKVKHQQLGQEAGAVITEAQRIRILENYLQLEMLKNELNGKLLFEYEDGLDTFVKEVVL